MPTLSCVVFNVIHISECPVSSAFVFAAFSFLPSFFNLHHGNRTLFLYVFIFLCSIKTAYYVLISSSSSCFFSLSICVQGFWKMHKAVRKNHNNVSSKTLFSFRFFLLLFFSQLPPFANSVFNLCSAFSHPRAFRIPTLCLLQSLFLIPHSPFGPIIYQLDNSTIALDESRPRFFGMFSSFHVFSSPYPFVSLQSRFPF